MNRFDLEKKNCHVCGKLLERNFGIETEWCNNAKCQVYKVKFSIPYKVKTKSTTAIRDAIKG